MISQRPIVEVRTEHFALIQWFWKEGYVHDSEYHDKVNAAMQRALDEAREQFDVREDCQLRCQWEGVQVFGSDLEKVKAAGDKLAKTLGRFKYVDFIG